MKYKQPAWMAGVYHITYVCSNCGKASRYPIQQGKQAPALLDRPCSNCGVKELRKRL